jgi:hypothetical protein
MDAPHRLGSTEVVLRATFESFIASNQTAGLLWAGTFIFHVMTGPRATHVEVFRHRHSFSLLDFSNILPTAKGHTF